MSEALAFDEPSIELPAPERPRLLIIAANDAPPGTLSWSTAQERGKALSGWARAVSHALPSNAGRALKLAWRLERLVARSGYAFPTDAYLAKETGIPPARVTDGLADLEKIGAIIRAHVKTGPGQTERRIWLCAEVLKAPPRSPSPGDTHTPWTGKNRPPGSGGQKINQDRARYSAPGLARSQWEKNRGRDDVSICDEDHLRRFAASSPVEAGAPAGARRPPREDRS